MYPLFIKLFFAFELCNLLQYICNLLQYILKIVLITTLSFDLPVLLHPLQPL